MKWLHVIAGMDPKSGGVSQAVRTMIAGLAAIGIHDEVVSLDSSADPFYENDLFPVHTLGPGKGTWRYSSKLIPWLLKNLTRFDVVIVHGLWLYHGYAVKEALRLLKNKSTAEQYTNIPKHFIMPHGMLDPYFQRASGRKFKAVRNWLFWKLIEQKVVHEASGLLFTCRAELELARLPFRPYRPQQEVNVGLGIAEPPAFNPRMRRAFSEQCKGLNNHSYFLFLSRIHEKKGVDILIKAYSQMARKWALIHEANAKTILSAGNHSYAQYTLPKLVIAGPGTHTSYGKKMQQMVVENPQLRNAVFFPGMLTGDAKWGAFYGCEAFVLPSHQENFGIAVVEALACGKPVLISNQVNIWRELKNTGGGIIADDTQQGTEEMIEVWVNMSKEKQSAMQDNARSVYEQYFAIGPVANRLLSTISDAVNG